MDMGYKKAGPVQIYDKRTCYDDGNIIPFSVQLAIVTHALMLQGTPHGYIYQSKSSELVEAWTTSLDSTKTKLDTSTVSEPSALQYSLFQDIFKAPFPGPENPKFTFIDLFAGIGGFRMALQNLGGQCVFSSEWDAQAQKTYYANYGEVPFGDITSEYTKQYIPDSFDILCAGFPCQAFSLAGKRLGFEETRGTLFFDVAEILRRKQPKAFFLENVKGLAIHDKGKTLKTILNTLDEVGYVVPDPKIVNAMFFGVPQHRERIYIVGFRKDLGIKKEDFEYPEQKEVNKRFIDIREKDPVPSKYYLSTTYVNTLIAHKERHASKGNGFGYEIIPDDGIANAIVVGGMGRERNIVIDTRQTDLTPTTRIKGEYNTDGWRRMTPREWGALQGYPVYDNGDGNPVFQIPVADASAYKQFGNSVAVPAIQATASQLLKVLSNKNILSL
jgi:DNA (cytosine-5)-methyltransferase 1